MKLKNKDVQLFSNMLISLTLKGKKDRLRVRLYKLLEDRVKLVVQENQMLIETYAKRDDLGEILYLDIEKSNPILDKEFDIELDKLANEYFYIDMNDNNKEMLINVCEILLDDDCEVETSGQMSLIFNNWLEECEKVLEYYNKENVE